MKPFFRLGAVCLCLILLPACVKQPVKQPYLAATAADAQKCKDLVRFPQNLGVYADLAGRDKVLVTPEEQARHNAKADKWFFSPWHLKKTAFTRETAMSAYNSLKTDGAFGENLRPFSVDYWEALKANCNAAAFPSRLEYGITVRNTAMRGMPTHRPFFRNPDGAGEGFPFDYFQTTAVWVGTPVLISHVSADGAWVLVENRLAAGWVPVEDIAVADDEFRELWQSRPLAAVIKDETLLQGGRADVATGMPRGVAAHIGTVLPLAEYQEDKDAGLRVLFPIRSETGRALWQIARLGGDRAVEKPMPLTIGNVAMVGNEMMGQPYGWGGMFENRDCSAMTRDLFQVFGVWLPRNSTSQGKWGTPVELEGLKPSEKEARIVAEATPFLSLVWLKGHIGLYVGAYEGVPVMFHNMWGLRTTDSGLPKGEQDGRAVIGKAVVTSLRPGAELPTISSSASLLDRIGRVSILPENDGR